MSGDKIFVIFSFLMSLILLGILLILEKQERMLDPVNLHPQNIQILSPKQDNLLQINLAKEKIEPGWLKASLGPIFLPYRNWEVDSPSIEAKSAILIEIKGENFETERILFQKNIEERLPVASLTKLMSAIIILENIDLSKILKINKTAVEQIGRAGDLIIGEELSVLDLLYAALLESSNDAIFAIAEDFGLENFVHLMNEKVKILNLKNTQFSNPMGLDCPKNFSSALDIAKLLKYSLKQPKLWEILRTKIYEVRDNQGKLIHLFENNNKLLEILPGNLAGKTGYTFEAGGCFAAFLDNPQGNSKIIVVLLGAPDENKRFEETKKLIDWVFKAYIW